MGALKLRAIPAAATLALSLLLLAGVAASAPTRQEVVKAEKLFNEARALMAKGKFEPACPKLEESQKLDPAPGTKYQLAACLEKTGRPATALAYYLEVADLARAAGFKDKEKVAREKAAALEPTVPRIVIEVLPRHRARGLTITRDGAPVDESLWNKPILLDPGEITLEASAPGKKPFKTTVIVSGEGTRVTTPIALVDVAPPPVDEPPPPPPKSSFGAQRIAALGVAAVGAGGIVVGAVFGLDAKPTYDKAVKDPKLCPTPATCYPEGVRLVKQAQTDATISTIAFAAGGVALAGGVVLFLTAPSGGAKPATEPESGASAVVVPVIGDRFGGLVVVGRF